MNKVNPDISDCRAIRSYVLRQGRITRGQQRALDSLWPKYGLAPGKDTPIQFSRIFKRQAPLNLEIGFGDGEALLETATDNPDQDYIGIEVHQSGVGNLMLRLEQAKLSNVRVFCHDAVEVLSKWIQSASLDRLNLYFPDPWHKKRHNKRRIVTDEFVGLVASRLKPGGVFHFATDWQPYAVEALEKLEQEIRLSNMAGAGNFTPRPESRPETKFERRGHKLGHGVWDVLMKRVCL